MGAGAEASIQAGEAASVRAAAVGGPIHLLRPGTEARPLSAQRVDSLHAQATITPGPAVISLGAINGLVIPARRRRPSRTGSGIRLEAKLEAADLRPGNRELRPQATREASTFSAETGLRDPRGQSAAFRVKAARSGKTRPRREMWFPDHNRSLLSTTRFMVLPPRDQRSGRTRLSLLRLRAMPAVRRCSVIEDFQAA